MNSNISYCQELAEFSAMSILDLQVHLSALTSEHLLNLDRASYKFNNNVKRALIIELCARKIYPSIYTAKEINVIQRTKVCGAR